MNSKIDLYSINTTPELKLVSNEPLQLAPPSRTKGLAAIIMWSNSCSVHLIYRIVMNKLVFLQDSFGRAKTWVKELQRQANPNIVIALAGNKADLANRRMVEYEVSMFPLTILIYERRSRHYVPLRGCGQNYFSHFYIGLHSTKELKD